MSVLPSNDNEALSSLYPPGLQLRLLQVLHRHGERTPVRRRLVPWIPPIWNMCAANDAIFASILQFDTPDKGKSKSITTVPVRKIFQSVNGESVDMGKGACFCGQLTDLGRQSTTDIGTRLREIYVDRLNFLPRTFDPNQFYLRSTDYARTQESIQQLISAGLYPSQFRPDSFALKIHTRDLNEDNLFPNPSCARLRTLAKQFKAVVAADMDEKMKSIAERLKGYVKEVTLDSHPSANGILDTIFAAKVHGIPIPPEFDDAIFLDLEEVVVKEWFHGPQQSEEMRRLGMGRLMGEIQDRIVRRAEGRTEEERKAGDDELKMAVYAGHDTSIAPMLILLDAFDNKWPPFSSIIIFELLQDTTVPPKKTSSWFPAIFASKKPDPVASASTHYVRVRYNDRILRLPGCAALGAHHASEDTSLCTMDAFRKIVEGQVPKNYIEECGVQQ